MNPIIEKKYLLARYALLCGVVAAAYAAAMGFGAASSVAADGVAVRWMWFVGVDLVVFGAVTGFNGLILWNVLRYGSEGISVPLLRWGFHLVVGALFVGTTIGAETAAMAGVTTALHQAGPSVPEWFVATIPARILFAAALYACSALWYSRADLAADERPLAPTQEPLAAPAGEALERITVRGAGGKIEVIDTRDILFLQAEGDYVAIVTASGRWLKEQTMKYFDESLPRGRFVRVHRSCIVAVGHISRIETSGRDHTVIVRGASTATGSRGETAIRTSDAGYKALRATLGV